MNDLGSSVKLLLHNIYSVLNMIKNEPFISFYATIRNLFFYDLVSTAAYISISGTLMMIGFVFIVVLMWIRRKGMRPEDNLQLRRNESSILDSAESDINVLFAFNQLRRYERMADLSNEDISKAVELSISSGVLCKYTGFVGISETHNPGRFDNAINHLNQAIAAGQDSMLALLDQDRQRITSANSSFSAVNSDACKVGFKKSRPIRGFFRTIYDAIFGSKNDPEQAPPPCNETYKEELEPYSSSPVNDNVNNNSINNDDNMLILLTRFQKADGYWENLEKVQSLAGIKIDHIDEIKINDKDIEIKCIATIIAVATLRVKYENKKNSWVLIEAKALTWLKKILGDQIDIEKVISKIESLL